MTVPQAPPPPPPTPQRQTPSPTLRGIATYEDGAPASNAIVAITDLASGAKANVTADPDGHFAATLEAGDHALAVTTEDGYSFVDKVRSPDLGVAIKLSRTCRRLAGHARGAIAETHVRLDRRSRATGDQFVGPVHDDGSFSLCLPEGYYSVDLAGRSVSLFSDLDLFSKPASAAPASLEVEAIAVDLIKQLPREVTPVSATRDDVVADILQHDARVIGLGEATHGNAEFVSSRAELTFELIRRADVRLLLFEFDAIVSSAIDDYVMGADVDLAKAVAALEFWITDTYELLAFFKELRTYNATARHKVHVAGVDVQNTKAPAGWLLANAQILRLSSEEKALLADVGASRKAVGAFTSARRSTLDALLARLANRRVQSPADLRISVAARSLIIQNGYFETSDPIGLYSTHRDAGMARLAEYLVEQTHTPRACVWAHNAHIARSNYQGEPVLGKNLAAIPSLRYYPVGFFLYEGSVRAWDSAGTVGVISHRLPRATEYMLEGAVMAAMGTPGIAWLPVRRFSPALRAWAETPRYARDLGAAYSGEERTLSLFDIPTGFDAVVVIKTVHDSSPTPTGIRKVTP